MGLVWFIKGAEELLLSGKHGSVIRHKGVLASTTGTATTTP